VRKSKIIGVYGASGFGREVMPTVRSLYPRNCDIVFIDDRPTTDSVNGFKVFTFEDFLEADGKEKLVTVCISDAKIRRNLCEKVQAHDLEIIKVIAPMSNIFDTVSLGEGAVVCPYVSITSNVRIGKGFHANIYSYVAHDCVIGDYVTFAPGVMCNGNILVEDNVYIGTGAIIKQGLPSKPLVIGEGSVVGMGAVVTKSVEKGAVVAGVPARSLNRPLDKK